MVEVQCTGWKAIDKGKVVGVAELHLPALGVTITDCMMLRGDSGGEWVNLPSRPMLDRDGKQMLRDDGKKSYAEIFKWKDRAAKDAFSTAAVAAIEAYRKPAAKAEQAGADLDDDIPF